MRKIFFFFAINLFIFFSSCGGSGNNPNSVNNTGNQPTAIPTAATQFLVGSWNIEAFGDTKISDLNVLTDLAMIISQFNVILLQEVRDSDESAIQTLLSKINETGTATYAYKASLPLGRSSSYKEQYVYFYRTSDVTLLDTYTYSDPGDIFIREPMVIRFQSKADNSLTFILIGIHAKPDDAFNELSALDEVAIDSINRYNESNIVLLGDMNADCSYLNSTEKNSLGISNSNYIWLIADTIDTTTTVGTDCTYDRIITYNVNPSAAYSNAGLYDFPNLITLKSSVSSLSNHYPVKLIISK